MKPRFLALAAILAVTAVAGGWRDAPMAPAPQGAGLGAQARKNLSLTPLEVTMECHQYFSSYWLNCTATASGGTGTGYTFEWTWGASSSSMGADSYADYDCSSEWAYYYYPGVTVHDSGGGYAYGYGGTYGCWQ
jgi:ABC-type phosphate transport system substrate-binding protein